MTTELPAPLVPEDVDLSDTPFPHELLVELSTEALGISEEQTIALAESLGWTRVPGGWFNGPAGRA